MGPTGSVAGAVPRRCFRRCRPQHPTAMPEELLSNTGATRFLRVVAGVADADCPGVHSGSAQRRAPVSGARFQQAETCQQASDPRHVRFAMHGPRPNPQSVNILSTSRWGAGLPQAALDLHASHTFALEGGNALQVPRVQRRSRVRARGEPGKEQRGQGAKLFRNH